VERFDGCFTKSIKVIDLIFKVGKLQKLKGGDIMSGKRKLEIVIVVAVVIVALGILGVRRSMSTRTAREIALMDELRAVRTAVTLYLEVNKAYPPNLKVLTSNSFTLGSKNVTYLTNVETDAEGSPVDAFGNKFNYDPTTGKVTSVQKGYEEW
jgi:type II secretory pathway pseudopilin PulG